MKVALLFAFLFSIPTFAAIPDQMVVTVPAGKVALLRTYRAMKDGPVKRQVLVGSQTLPEGSELRISPKKALLYRWILNDLGKIVQSSMPYFEVKVVSVPRGAELEDLAGPFYVHIRDMDSAKIVSTLYPERLPSGVMPISYPLLWDSFNPSGVWAHAVESSLRLAKNKYLVKKPPRDMRDFCPRFESLREPERELFWIALFNLIVRFESAYIPLTASDEGRYDEANKGVISSGLTQLSLASSRAACYQERGCSVIKNQNDLFQPAKGLKCSVGIMSCLVESGECLSCKKSGSWYGIARYWSTLRDPYVVNCSTCPGGKITIGKKPEIKELLKSTASFCF